MLSKGKKTGLILILSLIAILIEVLVLLYDQFYGSEFAGFLFEIGLTRWGWLPAFLSATAAIVGTICWKPGGRILQTLVILVSVIALTYASYWLIMIYSFAHLKP
ncbi:hypothetical protein ES703_65611 [subsurface metagenome]